MSHFLKMILVSVLVLICQASYADTPSDTLNQQLKTIQSLQADFHEQLLDNHNKTLQNTQGRMALKRPGMFRWETDKPNAQLIIANGTRLWIYDKDLEQVTIRKLSHEASETPALLLSDAQPALETNFQVSLAHDSSETQQKFILIPKNKNSMYAHIQMEFVNHQIKGMEMQDHLGHITRIQFNNIKINTPISLGLFKFTPPKNVDVIDESKKS